MSMLKSKTAKRLMALILSGALMMSNMTIYASEAKDDAPAEATTMVAGTEEETTSESTDEDSDDEETTTVSETETETETETESETETVTEETDEKSTDKTFELWIDSDEDLSDMVITFTNSDDEDDVVTVDCDADEVTLKEGSKYKVSISDDTLTVAPSTVYASASRGKITLRVKGETKKNTNTKDDANYKEGFQYWFNTDGKTSVTAGQQSNPYIFAGEDMADKTNTMTVNGNTYYSVQGANNPKIDKANPNGKIPTSGAYIKVIAPADGTITIYGLKASGKPFYITKGDEASVTDSDAFANGSYSISVKEGEEWYFYAQGSKAQFVGVVFETPKDSVTIPVELKGESLGTSIITLKDDKTGDTVEIKEDTKSVELKDGSTYTLSIDSSLLTIDTEKVDLSSSKPDKITITVSEAAKHKVSGSIKGLPDGAKVTKLTYTDEAGVATDATINKDTYSISLKNGKYTATASLTGAEGYEVYDHVEVTGVKGEDISNDVWFYGAATTYDTTYKSELTVGENGDYATINEAIAAATAMTRSDSQYVTIKLLDSDYEEQVIINTPNIKLVAADGVEPTVHWYYGIGYKYYSIDSTGYYNEKNANDKYDMNYAQRWGTVVRLNSKATGFIAEGITFKNTFNLYVSDKEIGDSKVGSSDEYGQSISGSLQERIKGLDVANTTNVERAAAMVVDCDQAEFYKCTFISSQDTLYTGSAHSYYRDCVIEGQTDYIFGNTGTSAIFDNCELKWLGYSDTKEKPGYITATRGTYLFRGCTITKNSANNITAGYLGRPWGTDAKVYFVGTTIEDDTTLNADGWYSMSSVNPEDVTFREYGNTVGTAKELFYTSYTKSGSEKYNKSFMLMKTDAEKLVDPANDSTFLGDWKPVNHITKAYDLSSVNDWNTNKEDTATTSDKKWTFKAFGTSTSSSVNTVADGADITDKVTINSATYNADGTINVKGGKFVADSPADGLSFYYTTIDPTTENFYLQADVTIDYINPTPDGQEGFAIMVRDTISGSGSYYSNQASVTGTKLPVDKLNGSSEIKDVVGVRDYTGMVSNEDATSNAVSAYRQGFGSSDKYYTVTKGSTYRVSLEKTDNGYVSKYYKINSDGSTGEVIGEYTLYITAKNSSATSVSDYSELDDPMTVQEANKAYLGFAVARGCNATFSNIEFKVTSTDITNWKPQSTVYTDPVYNITSPSTTGTDKYTLTMYSNAEGKATIKVDGTEVSKDVVVTTGENTLGEFTLTSEKTSFEVIMTPNEDFKFGEFEELSSYASKTLKLTVTKKSLGKDNTIYVSNSGKSTNLGTSFEDAVNLQTALSYASAGQTILLKNETYTINSTLVINRGTNGTSDNHITVKTEDDAFVTIDFNFKGAGLTVAGDYWDITHLNITHSSAKGISVSGNYNTIERCNIYNNKTTGLQISRYLTTDEKDLWPSYNTIKNCTAINNADPGYEDADGFAAKLTVGEGNVFDGCISAYNADDGWDLFAKAATGSIGSVTIKNSLAYRNGYVWAKSLDENGNISEYPEITCDENGTLTLVDKASLTYKNAGNGNGFKMGGTNLPGNHILENSIAYENKAKGIDSNSCTDIKAYNCTTYNNKGYNIAMYTNNKSATTGYAASGVLSFRKGTDVKEQFTLQSQSSSDVYGTSNYFWDTDTKTSHNTSSDTITVSEDWFESLDTSVEPTRNSDGSINMHGLLLLTDSARSTYETGAGGTIWGQKEATKATFWVVGDSTVSKFSDKYYIPREGYGEEIATYFNAENVYNLAHSGASSKDFTTMTEYTTLINGSDSVPKLGDADTDAKFLIIGFGHNDEKTEDARYTNPNGDYKTSGSFANSLYENYIKPALERGVTPVVVTPIVRLTDENTTESYNSASGHITSTTVVGDTTYEGGDYAQAIRDMCKDLGDQVILIDLTAATIEKNVELGDKAQYLHAFTGAKYADDEKTTLVGTGLDKTHTNSYGAKENAWLIAKLSKGTALGDFVKGKSEPSYSSDYANAINADYTPAEYTTPTTVSSLWPVYTDADGNKWYGTVFGDVGGADKITTENFTANVKDGESIELAVMNNRGKIASVSDAYIFYYTKLPAGTNFTLSATATVNSIAANNQVSYGLMARDDLYIDTYISSTMGDYVAAGTRNQGAVNCFGRKSTALYDGPSTTKTYTTGDTLDLKIVGTSDGFTLTYGENDTVSAGFDYALTTIDPDYIYVGFYVTRNADITFSNIKLEAEVSDNGNNGNNGSDSNDTNNSDSGSNDSSDSSSDSNDSDSSSSSSSDVITTPTYEIPPMITGVTISGNVGDETIGNATVDANNTTVSVNDTISLDLSHSQGVLNVSAVKKFYGDYDYIAAHLGNGVGVTINSSAFAGDSASDVEINVGADIVEVPDFAQGFDTVHVVPTQVAELPCDIYIHINVGVKNIGKKAYIFKLNSTENKYELKGVFDVNNIGNVAIATNEMTDIMVLVQE